MMEVGLGNNPLSFSYSFFSPPSLPSPSLLFLLQDYSEDRLVATVNSDLSNTLGNLLQRISTPRLNPGGPKLEFFPHMFPTWDRSSKSLESRACEEDYDLLESLIRLPGTLSGLNWDNIRPVLNSEVSSFQVL